MKLYHYNGRANIAGKRIREARLIRGLSQEGLAAGLQLAGLSLNQKAITRIETGKRVVPDYELLYFARVLNVGVTWLLGCCDPEKEPDRTAE